MIDMKIFVKEFFLKIYVIVGIVAVQWWSNPLFGPLESLVVSGRCVEAYEFLHLRQIGLIWRKMKIIWKFYETKKGNIKDAWTFCSIIWSVLRKKKSLTATVRFNIMVYLYFRFFFHFHHVSNFNHIIINSIIVKYLNYWIIKWWIPQLLLIFMHFLKIFFA